MRYFINKNSAIKNILDSTQDIESELKLSKKINQEFKIDFIENRSNKDLTQSRKLSVTFEKFI